MNFWSGSSGSVEAAFADVFMRCLHVARHQAAAGCDRQRLAINNVRAAKKWPNERGSLTQAQWKAPVPPEMTSWHYTQWVSKRSQIHIPIVSQALAHCRIKQALSWKNARVSSVQTNPLHFSMTDSS